MFWAAIQTVTANQIHSWFVKNVQDGKDEGQTSYVDRGTLQELLDLCHKAVKTKDASLLPPKGGYFFGRTQIDEGYWLDLVNTVKQLTAILENPKLEDCEFYYRTSW
jgi:hypothetical protein